MAKMYFEMYTTLKERLKNMFDIRKIAAAMTGVVALTGAVAIMDVPKVPFLTEISTASAAEFVPRQFTPRTLFNFGPNEFVERFNNLGQSNSESRLHAPVGEKIIIDEAESTFTNVHFDTDAAGNEIYAMTISGYEPDDVKTALLRTIYMIDRRYVSDASIAFEKIVVEQVSDEEGLADEYMVITKAPGKNAVKIYLLWG